jgi:serine beta-lactamase-like protein LACTB, mitochondrial
MFLLTGDSHNESHAMHLLKRAVFLGSLISFAALSRIAIWANDCTDARIQQSQKQAAVAAPEYSTQIKLARQAALEIYEHGMQGNSGSAIDNKIARPPGISVAVAVDGKLVWAEGFGLADLEQCVPVTPNTKFRIGSTSKPLTSAGAALLYDEGRLDLDAPIQRYVPSFPDKGQVITTRELLGQLAGIRHYNAAEEVENQKRYASVTDSLARFKDDPLIAGPGTKWRYSTYGYVLVSAVIEGASGQDFLAFMHDRVFLPLGMTNTEADVNDRIILNRARWYNLASDGSYRNSPYADLSYKWAGGGFLSTAEDLVRFGSALLKAGFLKQDTLALIFSPQKTSSGEKIKVKYGLGWEIHDAGDPDPGNHGAMRRFEHGGGAVGSSSVLIIYPDQNVVIAWLQNSDDFRDWPMSQVAAPFFPSRREVQPTQSNRK